MFRTMEPVSSTVSCVSKGVLSMFQTGYPALLFTKLSIEFAETVFAVVLNILDSETNKVDFKKT